MRLRRGFAVVDCLPTISVAMPELPDVMIYVESLRKRIGGKVLEDIRIRSPFLLRSVEPPIEEAAGKSVCGVQRLGKRIVIALTHDLHLVLHLMIAGRLQWKEPTGKPPGKITLATFHFSNGLLILTEAGTRKRASLHLCRGQAAVREHDPGGLEILESDESAFFAALVRERRTLKRALTDPRLFSGIGNAYSDEILHAARLSPVQRTDRLTDEEVARLYDAARRTLQQWLAVLRQEFADRFPGPGEITAFRDGFAVHGRFGKPCPVCATAVQRIRYVEHETNYCPGCQTGGKVLADRSLSRLLRDDWPRQAKQCDDF